MRGSRPVRRASLTTSVSRPRSPGWTDTSWPRQRLRSGSRSRARPMSRRCCRCFDAQRSCSTTSNRRTGAAQSRHVQSKIPGAATRSSSQATAVCVALREPRRDRRRRRSLHRPGARRRRAGNRPRDRSVHRHRRFDRAPGGRGRPGMGRGDSSSSRHRSRGTRAMARRRERHGGRRLLCDVRRPSTRDPLRT